MEKYLRYKDVMHAVLHHEGQAAVAAVQDLEAIEAIPVEVIKEEIQSYYDKYGDARGFTGTFVEVSIETLRKLLRDCGVEVDDKKVYVVGARGYGKTYASLEALRQMLEDIND